MKNFMIGQYGGFDQAKYARDFKEGFYGIEACLFESEEDIQILSFWMIASTGMFGVFMIRETMFGSKSTQKQSFNHVVSRCLRG